MKNKSTILLTPFMLFTACTVNTLEKKELNSDSTSPSVMVSEIEASPPPPSPVPVVMSMPSPMMVSEIEASPPLPSPVPVAMSMPSPMPVPPPQMEMANTEAYNSIQENKFKEVASSPLSTFSTDVDTASYANVRRFLNDKSASLPPKDSVRIEELINYFSYDYKEPQNKDPFYINTRVGNSIWNSDSKIIEIALQTKKPNIEKLPASNLVFLLDVSGSMGNANKLPLLKKSLKLLVKQLRAKDRVSMVVYAGNSGLVLDKARGDEEVKIVEALDKLNAGGSTAGGAGIKLAYKVAGEAFIEGGNNRVILATDGDFNVGQSSQEELVNLIEKKREEGVFLTVLGFGMGNYKDGKMEQLADKGNGNYAYIDNLLEAKKVLVTQMSGTLYTVAKDVKVQVEFNPKRVHSYRLIGYENRALANRDFNDDTKDAGEIGMGHSVTVLYEVVLASKEVKSKVDDLKYQRSIEDSNELATVKIRYKKPDGDISTKMSKIISDSDADINKKDFDFTQTVAGFGMLLRDSEYKKSLTFSQLIELAKNSKGEDREGYRAEFIKMMEKAELLDLK
ncbi:MAG: Von Willebrand factor type A domain protein [uncultured Sulfurovum sp.]|uniref:von Willebrand factor type A domain protein n=1 Tax=uncultured Sulfurovum sp. TaxID=269237 RepID=A0A6S6TXT7_9BACT|nr:MAG: Von Willebrand factor type A domain protein [uncultured Sulfurovum sp.]